VTGESEDCEVKSWTEDWYCCGGPIGEPKN